MKVTFLLNELLKSWFDEIFFGEIEFSTQCSLLSLHFVNIWKSLPYTQFFSSNQFRVKVDFSFCHSMYLVVCTCTYLLKFLQKCENERLFLLNFFREIVWIYLKVSFTEISSSMVRVKYNFEKQHCENLLPHFLTKISWKQRFYWRRRWKELISRKNLLVRHNMQHWKILFRHSYSIVIHFVKMLLSRNFCLNCVGLNHSNFHTVRLIQSFLAKMSWKKHFY